MDFNNKQKGSAVLIVLLVIVLIALAIFLVIRSRNNQADQVQSQQEQNIAGSTSTPDASAIQSRDASDQSLEKDTAQIDASINAYTADYGEAAKD